MHLRSNEVAPLDHVIVGVPEDDVRGPIAEQLAKLVDVDHTAAAT